MFYVPLNKLNESKQTNQVSNNGGEAKSCTSEWINNLQLCWYHCNTSKDRRYWAFRYTNQSPCMFNTRIIGIFYVYMSEPLKTDGFHMKNKFYVRAQKSILRIPYLITEIPYDQKIELALELIIMRKWQHSNFLLCREKINQINNKECWHYFP